jgi:hypothetical protein
MQGLLVDCERRLRPLEMDQDAGNTISGLGCMWVRPAEHDVAIGK